MATKANAKAGPGKAQKKGRSGGGRASPTIPSVQSARYTPPVPKRVKTSARWMGITILALFLVGILVVILDYADLLPGGVSNIWLVAAIAVIFAGLILATRYH